MTTIKKTTTKKTTTKSSKLKVVTTTKKSSTTKEKTTSTKKTTTTKKAATPTTANPSIFSSSSLASALAASLRSYSSSSNAAASSSANAAASFTRSSASASSAAARYTSSSAAAATAAAASWSQSFASASASLSRSSVASASRATSLSSFSSSSAAASLSKSAFLSISEARSVSASLSASISKSASMSSSRSRSAAAAVKTLATGQSFLAGRITSQFRWQASGYFASGCPWNVDGLNITSCYHMKLNATGDLADTVSSSSKREWDPEEDAAKFDDHLESYFEAFPEQIPDVYANQIEGRSLHKRQIASCSKAKTTTVLTTYTTLATITASASATSAASTATQTTAPDSTITGDDGDGDDDNDSNSVSDGATDSSAPTDSVATTTIVTATVITSSVVAATTTATSPRQRNEMYSWPGAPANETWHYTWKSFQVASTSTGVNFFHSWQLFRRDQCGGPVITLDYKSGQAVITDIVRPTCPDAGLGGVCPSVPVSQFWGKTVQHSMMVRYGLQGTFDYTVVDVADPVATPLLTYSATGDMGASSSIKFGEYRSYQDYLLDAEAFVGDYVAKRLA